MDEFVFLGANLDTRPEEAKQKDVHIAEVVASAAPVEWVEKKKWRTFPKQFQSSSGSCVAQTAKKLAGINIFNKEGRYLELSATSIYQERSNKPEGGMIGVEAFDIWKDKGISLEALVPSQEMSDAQMDALKIEQYERDIGKFFSISGHVGIPVADFETVASVIQATQRGVMVWFYFNNKEWSREIPIVLDPSLDRYAAGTMRHSVAAVDFGLIKGKKYLKIEDSAPFGGLSERWISEDFFKARNFFTRYSSTFKFEGGITPPPPSTFKFAKPLVFIPWDDAKGQPADMVLHEAQKADVIKLQDFLKAKGAFPANQSSTGYYGSLTAKGVYQLQVQWQVAPLDELNAIAPLGGRVGSKTIAAFNARL